MYVLEVRTNALLRSTVLIRLSYALLLLSILAFYFMLFSNSIPSVAGLFSLFVLLPLVPIMTSTSLPREWQSGTMELLKATPLPATRIVWGKFRAAVRFLGTLWIALLILPLVFCVAIAFYDSTVQQSLSRSAGVRGLGTIGGFLEVLLPVAAYLILYIAISIFCSSFFRRTAFALVTAYLAVTVVFFLPQLLSASVEIFGGLFYSYSYHVFRNPGYQGTREIITQQVLQHINPVLAFLSQVLSPSFYFFPRDSVWSNWIAEHGFKPVLGPSPVLNAAVFVPLILLTAWGFLRLTAWKLDRARKG
jgi:ABC-type transport system involved in multi-copper enzyme maturation permease subunit